MSIEGREIEKAKIFFNLSNGFDFEDLNKAYKTIKNNIKEKNKQRAQKGAPYRFSFLEIEQFYLILYKDLMIRYMRRLVLSGIDFKEENGILKPYIKDLDKKYEDFYKGNTVYKMEIDMLLDFIRIDFEKFETVDIALAKSVEEVNVVMDKFGSSITKTYENFAVQMISEAGKKAPYKVEGVVYAVDMSQVTSVVSLIKQTYDVIQSMYDKKVVINMFMDIAKKYENKVEEKEKNRMEDTQKYQSIKIYVLRCYSDLLREKDASKVIELFKEGISVISQMVEGSGVGIVPGTEKQMYPKPRK